MAALALPAASTPADITSSCDFNFMEVTPPEKVPRLRGGGRAATTRPGTLPNVICHTFALQPLIQRQSIYVNKYGPKLTGAVGRANKKPRKPGEACGAGVWNGSGETRHSIGSLRGGSVHDGHCIRRV